MIEDKYAILIAVLYAVSFFVFGAIWQSWRQEDKDHGRERFWVIKHYWRKFRSNDYLVVSTKT